MAAKTLRKMIINRVALVDVGSNPGAAIMLFKSKKEDPPQPEDKEFTDMKIDSTKYSKEEKEQLTALLAKGGVTVDADGPAPEELMKSLAPELRAIVEKAQSDAALAIAAAKVAQEQANEATATAQLEKSAREETEFVAKNTAIVKSFPGDADASARLLHRVKKAVKTEDFTALETLMKSGNEALAKLTNTELGHGEEGRTHGEAYAELKKKANDYAGEHKMSFSKAFDKVCDDNPALVAEYRDEKKSGARTN